VGPIVRTYQSHRQGTFFLPTTRPPAKRKHFEIVLSLVCPDAYRMIIYSLTLCVCVCGLAVVGHHQLGPILAIIQQRFLASWKLATKEIHALSA